MLSQASTDFLDNDLTSSAAALSYFSTLGLFPLLLLLLNVSTTVFGKEELKRFLVYRILELLPGSHDFVLKNVEAVTEVSNQMLISCFILVIWTGSWSFRVIEKAFSRIWKTECRSFIHGRLVTITVTVFVGLALMSASLISSVVNFVRSSAERIPVTAPPIIHMFTSLFWQSVFSMIALLVTIELFTIIYRFLPNKHVRWKEALPGAVVAGVLWEAAKYCFSHLLPYFHYDVVYGSIGAGIVLLSWIYISSLIMLYGAQLCATLREDRKV
ncbi:MAG: YihY/virulence factor BrkB family protein [Acidobacteriota bacterium]|nr:YihY/virulence factor BrkB family protein [Blastocatellia bacterium]MDW8411059.1 YihY/virulence factor BrkB family protein [Acidobacteriota bacterium]